MNITIRRETKRDFNNIYQLVKAAFETAKVSDGEEQEFVNQLRASENYIPELALVAEDEGELIGHLMLTKFQIQGEETSFETLLLAPLSVKFEYRQMGVGSLLVRKSFELAKQMGHQSVIVLGDPSYYSRFDFKTSTDFNIRCLNDIPAEYIQACELTEKALEKVSGTIQF